MGRFTCILLALLFAAGSASPSGAGGDDAARLGQYALTDLDGGTRTLGDYHGDVVVVNFWASWCAPCLKELPILDDWHAEWAPRGAKIAAISVDSSSKKARRFVEEAKLKMDVYHDGPDGLAKQLDLPFLPCTYVLDRSGKVVLVTGGSSKEELARVQRTVEALLSSTNSASLETAAVDGGVR